MNFYLIKIDEFEKSTSYVEFIQMGQNKPKVNDENIINDLVNMDAMYDPEELPDFSIGLNSNA